MLSETDEAAQVPYLENMRFTGNSWRERMCYPMRASGVGPNSGNMGTKRSKKTIDVHSENITFLCNSVDIIILGGKGGWEANAQIIYSAHYACLKCLL